MAAKERDNKRKAELLELSETYEKLASEREAFLKKREENNGPP